MRCLARAWAFTLLMGLGPWTASEAGAMRYCDQPAQLSAQQKDRLFRFGAIIKTTLEESGRSLALIARSGLDLGRFGVRYSHAGVSLKAGLDTPWSVRQLYYACDENMPRIFDQGISGFLLGLNDPAVGYVSVVLLPAAEAAPLERTVLDKRQALQALGTSYSANAYPFSQRYQNCNQWVAEMLAAAWSGQPGIDSAGSGEGLRAQAQRWLLDQHYQPSVFDVGYRPLMWLARLVPWLHDDDHPTEDLDRAIYRVSMPASIEAFVQATVPAALRLEFCHAGQRVVIRRGWEPIAEGCLPGEQDTVIALE
jgi:hypothetical protein